MSSLAHPLSWFVQRQGQIINRNGRSFKIKSQEVAEYCHELQESGIKFSDPVDVQEDNFPRKAVNISFGGAVCTACEG